MKAHQYSLFLLYGQFAVCQSSLTASPMEGTVLSAVTLFLLTGFCSGQDVLPPEPVNSPVRTSAEFSIPAAPETRIFHILPPQNPPAFNTHDERISGAYISNLSRGRLIAGKSSVYLSCQADTGTNIFRVWRKDGKPLFPSDRISFHDDKRDMLIHLIEGKDNGEYLCHLSNRVSEESVTYNLFFNYGPQDVLIQGANDIEVGQTVVLICSASSEPPARFTWTLNGTETSVTTAVYIKDNATYGDSGNYTCVADNAVTRSIGFSAVHVLTIQEFEGKLPLAGEPASCPGPPIGFILGGVVGCLGCVGLAVAVAVIVMKTKRRPRPHQMTVVNENGAPMGPSAEYGNLSGKLAGQSSSRDADRSYEELQFKDSAIYNTLTGR
ncbi:hypothetical protein AGOR_G00212060 [Albula goreensis]|uniref:Ig-like domain-containing protein n=1 Tax=Albula goreensis TaxID=1534307 RepID=A0A8T3CR22_9TELE|nr:hypothetical protein AGOR_G00212060 [Albula goreensis]